MERVDGRLVFSATDLINHLECPHLTYLNIEVALGRAELEQTRSDTTDLLDGDVERRGDPQKPGVAVQQEPAKRGGFSGSVFGGAGL